MTFVAVDSDPTYRVPAPGDLTWLEPATDHAVAHAAG